ncbi:MAG: acyl-CoA dehydrogenase family protein [Deltaproteobacteria bacterium]|nr:acyl-CoA dehydrogenase family protein [Deltaproteobacteria bacterium]
MNLEFNEEVTAIQKMARKFAQNEILPRVAEDEENHRFQKDIINKMGEIGFFGCPIPEEYGGSNLGFLAHTVVTEEISKISGSIRAAGTCGSAGNCSRKTMYSRRARRGWPLCSKVRARSNRARAARAAELSASSR